MSLTKTDLIDRRVVELRNGNICIIIGNRIVGHDIYLKFNDYLYNVDHMNNSEFDIIKVGMKIHTLSDIDNKCFDWIWIRDENKRQRAMNESKNIKVPGSQFSYIDDAIEQRISEIKKADSTASNFHYSDGKLCYTVEHWTLSNGYDGELEEVTYI